MPRHRGDERGRRERGAALVEFALLAPLLLVLVFGIVEFGWGLAQQLDLRHKAREALRLVIVDGDLTEIQNAVCTDDIIAASDIVRIENLSSSGDEPGDPVTVEVEANLEQITGFFSWAWSSNTLTSEVVGRVEQPTTNLGPGGTTSCP